MKRSMLAGLGLMAVVSLSLVLTAGGSGKKEEVALASLTDRAAVVAVTPPGGKAGAFELFSDLAFSGGGSLGENPWVELAGEVGIQDTLSFRECLKDRATVEAIVRDTLAATRLGVRATPTFLINHIRVNGFLRAERMDKIVGAVLPPVGSGGDGGG